MSRGRTPHPPAAARGAVVTGASSGIGAAIARDLADRGHPVVLAARRVDRLAELAADIAADGGRAVPIALDLNDAGSIAAFCTAATAALDGTDVDILVSCAGDVHPRSVLGTTPEDFLRQLEINLLGAHRLVQALVPPMLERTRGDVVFVSSDVVVAPRPLMASYVSSKWGLEGLARALQMELEGTGVRASVVRPGPTQTGLGTTWQPDDITSVVEEWSKWGFFRHQGYLTPDGVAAAVAAVVGAPPGTHLRLIEVEPEAPVRRPAESSETVAVQGES